MGEKKVPKEINEKLKEKEIDMLKGSLPSNDLLNAERTKFYNPSPKG